MSLHKISERSRCPFRDSSCPSLQAGGRTLSAASSCSNSFPISLSDTLSTALFWRCNQDVLPSQKDACGPCTIQGVYSTCTSCQTCHRRKGDDGRPKIWINSSSADLSSGTAFTMRPSFLHSSDWSQVQTGNWWVTWGMHQELRHHSDFLWSFSTFCWWVGTGSPLFCFDFKLFLVLIFHRKRVTTV